MKLADLLQQRGPSISVEFFPPKTDQGEANLWTCIDELKAGIDLRFVSVTYGAGGSTQDRTKRIVTRIKAETGLEPMAHLTCVGSTKEELGALLDEYTAAGIENILALRGDAPEGMDKFEATAGGFAYASDLVRFIHERDGFSIGVATYPEGHPESKGGMQDDVRYLKLKQENGAAAAITQYFFDNEDFYRFRDAAERAGVTIPIIPGIMPVTNFATIQRFSGMCGASIPMRLRNLMEPLGDDLDAIAAAGIDFASEQCRNLLEAGVPGLHFYALNRSEATLAVCHKLGIG